MVLLQRKNYVLGLQVRVDDFANAVQVVEPEQRLVANLAHDGYRHSAVVVLLDQTEQVLAEHLERHHRVAAVRAVMEELVEHL